MLLLLLLLMMMMMMMMMCLDGADDGEYSGGVVRTSDACNQLPNVVLESPCGRETTCRGREANDGSVEVELPGHESED